MRIKRLLDDREESVGDRIFDAQGRPTRFKPADLGCYVVHLSRADRGLAKERLRDYWEG
jgi:hypothetical protein